MKFQIQLLMVVVMLSASLQVGAGEWQLGVATETSQPAIQQTDIDNTTLPLINYIGEKFSFIGWEFSYQLLAERQFELSLVAAPRREGYEAGDSPALAGMKERDAGFDLGVQASTQGIWGGLQLRMSGDISGTHDGGEIVASYRYPRQFGRWMIEPTIGIALQSRKLVGYYYGVDSAEVMASRGFYPGRQAVNRFAEITVGYHMERNWLVLGGFHAEALDRSIVDSPIVDEDYTSSVYAALLYTF